MKARELRKKALVELGEDLANMEEDLFNQQFRLGIDEAVKVGRLRAVRKDIARLKTVIRQKELAGEGGGASKKVTEANNG